MPDSSTNSFLSHLMKPIKEMLGLGVEVQLQLAHRIAAIREKGYLLIHLHPLGFQHLEHAPLGLGVIAMHEGKTLRRSLGGHALACNHFNPQIRQNSPQLKRARSGW